MTAARRTVPFWPLYKRVHNAVLEHALRWNPRSPEVTYKAIADYIGVHHKTVARWMESDQIGLAKAEEIADYLGMHPAEIWGRRYYDE